MEGFMSAIGSGRTKDATARAQDVMYDAWEQTSRRARVALAHKALAISPFCADAYVLLAQEEAKSAEAALELYRKGVAAGEHALGREGFKEYSGHFWGFLETRPYMRARAGLAASLKTLGDVDGAINHYRDMLRLNPGDNQGIRYVLAACLMTRGDTEALRKLLKQYDGDCSAHWLYTQALVAFREDKGDKKAEELARRACNANAHVAAVLAGTQVAKPSTNGYVTVGGEDEAADYVGEWSFDWHTTPGATDWLKKIATETASSRAKGPPRRR